MQAVLPSSRAPRCSCPAPQDWVRTADTHTHTPALLVLHSLLVSRWRFTGELVLVSQPDLRLECRRALALLVWGGGARWRPAPCSLALAFLNWTGSAVPWRLLIRADLCPPLQPHLRSAQTPPRPQPLGTVPARDSPTGVWVSILKALCGNLCRSCCHDELMDQQLCVLLQPSFNLGDRKKTQNLLMLVKGLRLVGYSGTVKTIGVSVETPSQVNVHSGKCTPL